jgi:hypothetical protein
MQIVALEGLLQIQVTSLTLRLTQGFVTELKDWFLIARVVLFHVSVFFITVTLIYLCEAIFYSTAYFFTLERVVFVGRKITNFASFPVCTFYARMWSFVGRKIKNFASFPVCTFLRSNVEFCRT